MGACTGKDDHSQIDQANGSGNAGRRRLTVLTPGGDAAGNGLSSGVPDVLSVFKEAKRKVWVHGLPCDVQQKGFADKLTATHKDGEEPVDKMREASQTGAEALQGFQVGWSCKKGLKPDSPNQDDFCIFCVDTTRIFGVFDGHGPCGHDISNFAQDALPRAFVHQPRFEEVPEEALKVAFKQTHDACVQFQLDGRLDCTLSGCTGTTVVQRGQKLHVAHVGDSRAVIARGQKQQMASQDLTDDHKPSCPEERQRIEAAGGEVRRLPGDIPHRVFLRGKMYPGLAMTRAIGDTVGVVAGVTSVPEVKTYEVQKDWHFMLICSDGVWEFMSSQDAVDIVNGYGPSEAQAAAEKLSSEAWTRWIQEEGNVVDDITVVCAWFKHDE